MEETISLKELLQSLRKRLVMIMGITLTAVIVSGVISFFFLTPIYQASTQILVNQKKSEQSMYNPSEVQTNLQLINTYNVIIKSPAILNEVAKELNLDITAQQLNEKIIIGSENQSQVVNISVQDENPETAAAIANTIAKVFENEIVEIMNVDNVSVLAEATVIEGQSPVKPLPILNIAIALVVGLLAGVGLAFLLEYFDNTLKNEQDIEKTLGLPILGSISVIEGSQMDTVKEQRGKRNSKARGEAIGS
ncbi:YveK family protein [Mesobacillus foraminis]|uniref:Capsular polysaccharide biosynthesis protein n=1 Tax=Mesobacillus foraminis TaxID=279826 RepID=A0A4R2BB60_9BACI|nr:Wzz/FepE/Etk N-terminal domain-containing protein [Mesobacillus foraminis]TCN24158.1 capsular polysaccharide biosynthesis protein [Mesobacillus foraminis]